MNSGTERKTSEADGLKSIGACAFFNRGKLAAVTVPESVTRIGELALPDSRAEQPQIKRIIEQKQMKYGGPK